MMHIVDSDLCTKMDELYKTNICSLCDKRFKTGFTLKRHLKSKTCIKIGGKLKQKKKKTDIAKPNAGRGRPPMKKTCDDCNKEFSSRRSMLRHRQMYHSNIVQSYPCGHCNEFFPNGAELDIHRSTEHPTNSKFRLRNSAFRGACQVFRIDIPKNVDTINEAIAFVSNPLLEIINKKLIEMNSLKYNLSLGVEYERGEKGGLQPSQEPERMLMNFRSHAKDVLLSTDISNGLAKSLLSVENSGESFNSNGSDWYLHKIYYLDIEFGQCRLLSGSCNLHRLNQARDYSEAFNVKADDEYPATAQSSVNDGRCFYYAIAAYFNKGVDEPEILEKFIEENIVEAAPSPVKVSDISKIEEANSHLNIAINVVYRNALMEIFPVHVSKREDDNCEIINILLFHMAKVKQVEYDRTNIELSDHSSDEEEGRKEYDFFNLKHVNMFEENDETLADPTVPHYALVENLNKEITRARYVEATTRIDWSLREKNDALKKLNKEISEKTARVQQILKEVSHDPDNDICERLLHEADNKQYRISMLQNFREDTLKHIAKLEVYREEKMRETPKASHTGRHAQVCYNCFSTFSDIPHLKAHKKWCYKEKSSILVMPLPTDKIEFEPKRKQTYTEIQMFADFEALQVKPEYPCSCVPELSPYADSCSRQSIHCNHGTLIEYEQHPFNYCIVVVSNDETIHEVIEYSGEDAVDHFLTTVLDLEEKYMEYLQESLPLALSEEQEKMFQEAESCYVCGQAFDSPEDKVRDHDHHGGGQYRGACHNICNLQLRSDSAGIPIYMHNFSGYDSHFIIRGISKQFKRIYRLSGIPLNTEKFKTLTINRLEFKDSMNFLDGSLEKLVQTLVKSNHKFPLLKKVVKSKRKRDLLLRKGSYPYEFVKSIDQLKKQTTLPPKEAFYSKLSGQNISQDDYDLACKVWKVFECKNMLDYTQIYVISDTILLAECIQTFRKTIYHEFDLDPAHYVSLPALSKDIMLKTSNCTLDYILDEEMAFFFKNAIRGGLSFCGTRSFDVDEMEKKTGKKFSILYVDANALYGEQYFKKIFFIV